jgi:hypothetical protein
VSPEDFVRPLAECHMSLKEYESDKYTHESMASKVPGYQKSWV